MVMVGRDSLLAAVRRSLAAFPVTLLLGPRQCGKTTLARQIVASDGGHYFDLEDPDSPLRPEAAKIVLRDLQGLVVIDEFHRQPGLFNLLRVLADRSPLPARFLILGSASLDLARGVSESLAGRVAYVEMGGFDVAEAGAGRQDALWVRGGFPASFLAPSDAASLDWRAQFVRSFLERDVPQLGLRVPAAALRRFWTMVARYHGQVWNAADFARALGVKGDTARHYLDILCGAFVVRQLPPWHANVGKRLVKSPKVYVRDSGLLHALLGLGDADAVRSHPALGFSWEGFALEQAVALAGAEREAHFYRTHAGGELDLLIVRGGRRTGFEFKYEDAPGMTRSMHGALADLELDALWVIHPGDREAPLSDRVRVAPLAALPAIVKGM